MKSWFESFSLLFIPHQMQVDDFSLYKARLLVGVALITAILMWSYAFVAYFYLEGTSVQYLGFVYSLLHISCLAVLRLTGSQRLSTNTLILGGFAFQIHFALLHGGANSPVIFWIAILPVIGGQLAGQWMALGWGVLVTCSALMIIYLQHAGLVIQNYLNDEADLLVKSMTILGLLSLNSIFTVFLVRLDNFHSALLGEKILSKQNILRILSHDIKNPLSAILMAKKCLEHAKDSKTSEKFLEKIERNGLRINAILESTRFLEAIDTGKVQVPLETCDIKSVVEHVLEVLGDTIIRKELKIGGTLFEQGQCLVRANQAILENQVLANILSNAIKFSDPGSTIEVNLSQGPDLVQVAVKDYGVGMPQAIVENIFSPFAATSRLGTSGEKGTGFGMPIAKSAMEKMGGDIKVHSQERKESQLEYGTEFILEFPAKLAS